MRSSNYTCTHAPFNFIMHIIFQVTESESESDMNDDFKKPDISLLEFLKSKFIRFRLQRCKDLK